LLLEEGGYTAIIGAHTVSITINLKEPTMIVAGVILLLLGYLLPLVIPVPIVLATVAIWLGWILLIVGVILWLLGSVGRRPVYGRRHFW
jgi:hypothetical protein